MKLFFFTALLVPICYISSIQKLPIEIAAPADPVVFIDSASRFNSIEEVLTLPQFRNKVVYIDLWATTCIPCIKEFAFSEKLHQHYQDSSVAFLYVCYNYHANADDPDRQKWKTLVKQYNLSGTHLYAYVAQPDKLVHEIVDLNYLAKHADKMGYAIPNYFIAAKGKIITFNAERPSNIERVVQQIDSIKAIN